MSMKGEINQYDCRSNCTVVIIMIQGYFIVPQWVSCSVLRRRGGRNCFCVWRFWRTVICCVYQRGGVQYMQYIVIWDNVSIHRSALVQNWFQHHPQFTVLYLSS